jgi:hypothetical protein
LSDETVIPNFMRWFESHESQGNQHTLSNKVLYALCQGAGHEAPRRELSDQDLATEVLRLVGNKVGDGSALRQAVGYAVLPNRRPTPHLVEQLRGIQELLELRGEPCVTAAACVRQAVAVLTSPPFRAAQPVREVAGARSAKYRKPQTFWTDLGLSWRTADALIRLDVVDVWELWHLPEAELARGIRVGPKSLARVMALAAKHGVVLGGHKTHKNWREDLLAARLRKLDGRT